MEMKAVILAAGKGTRMNSDIPKVLHKIFNKTLVEYTIDSAKGAGVGEICLIVGHMAEEVKQQIGDGVSYRLQAEQLGTGHAVKCALDFMDDFGEVLILYGDTPLITRETLCKLRDYHVKNKCTATVLSAKIDNPTGYGRIIRNGFGEFEKIVEERDATNPEKRIKEINGGMYIFNSKVLKQALTKITNNNSQKEYYFTDVLDIIINERGKVEACIVADNNEIVGINTKVQLAEAAAIMKNRINTYHLENGVIIEDPSNVYIEPDVKISPNTTIEPSCVIKGNTTIGSHCVIGYNTKIINSQIANKVHIESSVILDSTIGQNSSIGPFAYIRPNSHIANNVKVGDFVEIKNSTIDEHTKISHLTYVGDADVGKNVNFGCGTVLVNYDGKNKYRTEIQDNVFIGCNTNLISPVVVAENSYIAAGSTITDDVPEDALAIARARQVNKEGGAKDKRKL
ncbi:MAG: UDP-N-acetylglucosamine diphosphorylase/glucosamine-1-phosphate N-acetyltransferase [Epulopiscium sp. Nuni2H_MBin003]|nr:MAG: UDP-N-acetylglucosamine diphosphorylase/glucosamine-1-phosphate N-acetyltransferase [Epulopiscium sp. Nuni2H_MBin003]